MHGSGPGGPGTNHSLFSCLVHTVDSVIQLFNDVVVVVDLQRITYMRVPLLIPSYTHSSHLFLYTTTQHPLIKNQPHNLIPLHTLLLSKFNPYLTSFIKTCLILYLFPCLISPL